MRTCTHTTINPLPTKIIHTHKHTNTTPYTYLLRVDGRPGRLPPREQVAGEGLLHHDPVHVRAAVQPHDGRLQRGLRGVRGELLCNGVMCGDG